MDLAAPRGLPGKDATRPSWTWLVFAFPGYIGLKGLFNAVRAAPTASPRGGHLPWPVVQWALGTSAGVMALAGVLALAAWPFVTVMILVMTRAELADTRDVTEAPREFWWPWPPPPAPPRASWFVRWLGRDAARRWQGALWLGLAVVLAVPVVWGWGETFGSGCVVSTCRPNFQLLDILAAAGVVALFGGLLFKWWWLRRVEAACGIWLRHGRGGDTYWYIRWPGVTAEETTAALALVAPAATPPAANMLALALLAALPLSLALVAAPYVELWLQMHWIAR